MGRPIVNRIGQRFGKLIVINDSGKRKIGRVIWLCKCDCGNITEVSAENLIHNTRSCGKCINLLGKKIDMLSVISETRRNNNRAWLCKCDCGNFINGLFIT